MSHCSGHLRRSRVRSRRSVAARTGGFTLIELMIALTVGVFILMSATGFAITTWQSLTGAQIRESVARNARFIGMSLERDLREAGVAFESNRTFGSVAVRNDTLTILGVPFESGSPTGAPAYFLAPPTGDPPPDMEPDGSCGPLCVDLKPEVEDEPVDLAIGDLAALQMSNERRLILINGVTPGDDSTAVTFTAFDSLIHRPANFAGGIALTRLASVQELKMVAYYRVGQQLMRAERLRADGTLDGFPVARNVQSFDVTLIFIDGDEATAADPTDTDDTNDYDDLVGVRVRVVLLADRTDPRVNGGERLARTIDWRFSPRNLMYERNVF